MSPYNTRKRKSNYSTTDSVDFLNNTRARRRHTTNNDSIYDLPTSPTPLTSRSEGRSALERDRQSNSPITSPATSSEAGQEQLHASLAQSQEQPESPSGSNREIPNSYSGNEEIDSASGSGNDDQEHPQSSPELNQEQPKSSGESKKELPESYSENENSESPPKPSHEESEGENNQGGDESDQDDTQGEEEVEDSDGERSDNSHILATGLPKTTHTNFETPHSKTQLRRGRMGHSRNTDAAMSDHNETESGARSPKTRAQLTKNQSAVMLNENHTEPSHRSPRTHPQRSRQPEVVIPRYNEREPRTRLQRSRNADAARSHYDATNTMIRSPGTRRRQNLRITDATMSDRSDKISNDINAIIPTETAPEVPASPSNPGEPETVFYEGLAKKDIELKDWVVDKVQIHSAWSEVWMEFYVGAFKLLDYVHSPMPASFKDALQFIKHWTELYDDLETPPTTKLGMQTSRFRAATFSEIKGILNFSDLPNGGYDREEAGEVVVELEGYLLPHLAILVMRSFKAYTQFGRMVTSAFDDSLGLLVDCSERINALRSYYTSEINQQRSWRLGKRAKKIRTGLKQHTLRMFVTAQARESFETGRPPATFNKWTQSEERWLREAWDMYRSSEVDDRYILIKMDFASHFSRHTLSELRLKVRQLELPMTVEASSSTDPSAYYH